MPRARLEIRRGPYRPRGSEQSRHPYVIGCPPGDGPSQDPAGARTDRTDSAAGSSPSSLRDASRECTACSNSRIAPARLPLPPAASVAAHPGRVDVLTDRPRRERAQDRGRARAPAVVVHSAGLAPGGLGVAHDADVHHVLRRRLPRGEAGARRAVVRGVRHRERTRPCREGTLQQLFVVPNREETTWFGRCT